MTRWLLTIAMCLACQFVDNSLAWEIPYGVQDPMLGSAGWMSCEGHEIGYWNVTERETGGRRMAYLVLTSVDLLDPAFVICVVPADRKVMVMESGKHS